jgi:hypothetical protein
MLLNEKHNRQLLSDSQDHPMGDPNDHDDPMGHHEGERGRSCNSRAMYHHRESLTGHKLWSDKMDEVDDL